MQQRMKRHWADLKNQSKQIVTIRCAMEKPPRPETTGLARLGSALRYSVDGLQATYQHEAAFRQEVIVAAVLIPLALWL